MIIYIENTVTVWLLVISGVTRLPAEIQCFPRERHYYPSYISDMDVLIRINISALRATLYITDSRSESQMFVEGRNCNPKLPFQHVNDVNFGS